jgi:hypothetical protein
VGVHHRAGAGRRVHRQVHRRLRRRFLRAAALGPVHADHADVGGAHVPVRNAGRRDQHLVADTHAHVARAADGQPVVQQAVAVADKPFTVCAPLVTLAALALIVAIH